MSMKLGVRLASWESLQKRRKDNRLILLYNGLKGKFEARILTDDLIPKVRRCRNQHYMTFQIPSACKDTYKIVSSLELSVIGMTSLG